MPMRIISGKYKGRLIKMPRGIRPTQDKVRKALFDILGDIKGLSFLELFAGSGAVGIEALSRGVREAVFVEDDRGCIEKIEDNLSLLSSLSFRVIELDVLKATIRLAKEARQFDIIFLDPPYYKDIAKKNLQILEAYDILAPNGFAIVQHFKKEQLPKESGNLVLIKESRYGDTVLSFYRKRCQ